MALPEPAQFLPVLLSAGKDYEFDTFVIGMRLPGDRPHDENSQMSKPFKRALGQILEQQHWPGRTVCFDRPDLQLICHPDTLKVTVLAKPIFVAGRYRKFSRTLSSSHWKHMRCRGKGCPKCRFRGFLAEGSVGELVGRPIQEAAGGEQYDFHGMGREDVDARMLGTGRPFVVEVMQPRRRTLDLELLKTAINDAASGRAEVAGPLAPVPADTKGIIKEAVCGKTYSARVVTAMDLPGDAAQRIAGLSGRILKQRTPTRVRHRRADMIRERDIMASWATILDARTLIWHVQVASGTYVKELASSDGGQSRPSLSEILGVPAMVQYLDVLAIHYRTPWE